VTLYKIAQFTANYEVRKCKNISDLLFYPKRFGFPLGIAISLICLAFFLSVCPNAKKKKMTVTDWSVNQPIK